MGFLGSLKRSSAGARTAAGPEGRRAYAIGDVHGRLDLLERLLDRIAADNAARAPSRTTLIFLGDLIDRGPRSAQVVDRLRSATFDDMQPVFLLGNHEEVLLRLLRGDSGLFHSWLKFGGRECARSYGLDPRRLARMPEEAALAALREAIPQAHVDFLEAFGDTFRFGDYLFVHAGIRPGVELALQRPTDLRWIRSPFLEDERDHGFLVVHGHSISAAVDERANRIGIDTGAYRSGLLTALGVEGRERWFVATSDR